MRQSILLSVLLGSVAACDRATTPPAVTRPAQDRTFDVLLGLIRSRLEVMHEVARWKWAKKAAIEDPEREAALLLDLAEKGIPLGLDREMTLAFFRGQIEAAKVIQRADFRRWEASGRGPEGEAPDLVGVLRPRIDGLNRDMLAALAEVRSRLPDGDSPDRLRRRADQLLVGEGIDARVRDSVIGPLTNPAR
jgi:chorismate mutase